MYTAKEIFSDEGCELKEILKSCIYNYYLKYKEEKKSSNELQKNHIHHIIKTSNKEILSNEKGDTECTASTIMTI